MRRISVFQSIVAGLISLVLLWTLGGWSDRLTQVKEGGFPRAIFQAGAPVRQIAALGGLNRVGANLYWIRSYRAWERQDAAEALRCAALASWMHPEQWFFWHGSAHMIAYDFPRWEFAARGSRPDVEAVAWSEVRDRYGNEALRWLDAAKRALPQEPQVELAAAHICLNVLADTSRARSHFRNAWEMQNDERPWFAARIYGELLRVEGDLKGALDWYRELLPQLPLDVPAAERSLVENRIRALAAELEKE